MLKHIIIVAFVIFYNRFIVRLSNEYVYNKIVEFASTNNIPILGLITFVSVALVIASYVSLQGGMYRFLYSFSKILMQLSMFLIAVCCFYNIYFWFSLELNLLSAMSYLSFLTLFELLIATCVSVRFIDFNYHFQNTLVEAMGLAFISVLFVEVLAPVYFL